METFELIIILVFCVLIAIAYRLYGMQWVLGLPALWTVPLANKSKKVGGTSRTNDPICAKTDEFLDKFITDRFTPEGA